MGRALRGGLVVSAIALAAGCGKKATEPAQPTPPATVEAATRPPAAEDASVAPPAQAAEDASVAPSAPAPEDASVATAAPPGEAPADATVAPPEEAPADATAAAQPSLDDVCAAITKTTEAAFAKVEAQKAEAHGQADKEWPDLLAKSAFGSCVKGPGGAFAVEVVDGAYHAGNAEVPGGSSEMAARLVFVDAHGARTELKFDALEDEGGANMDAGVARMHAWSVEAVSDWNGDGTAEVALRRAYQSPELAASWIELYRVVPAEGGGAPKLERWLPIGDAQIAKVADDDGDGRLDLFSHEVFQRYVSLGEEVPTSADGIDYFHHALADGTFETGGDAAKAYYRKACGGAKVAVSDIALGDGATVESVLGKAACARLYGATVEALRKRIDGFLKKARGTEDLDPSPAWLAEVPVTLE